VPSDLALQVGGVKKIDAEQQKELTPIADMSQAGGDEATFS
jgi:hypothetical protein